MIHIYQVGEVVVELFDYSEDDYSVTARGRSVEYMHSQEVRWPNTQWISEVGVLRRRGVLYSTCGLSVHEMVARMQGIAGKPLPVIGYFNPACNDDLSPCDCEDSGDQMVWVETTGRLRAPVVNWRGGQGKVADITIEIEYNQQWELMNRYTWAWRSYPIVADDLDVFGFTANSAKALAEPYPTASMVLSDYNCHAWYRRRWSGYPNAAFLINPDWWTYEADYALAPNFPVQRFAVGWDNAPQAYSVSFDPNVWNMPPRPIYAFTNLPDNGNILISVERENPPYNTLNNPIYTVSTISLDTLSEELDDLGLDPLASDDIIYMGHMHRMPGVLVRPGISPGTYDFLEIPRPDGSSLNGPWAGFLGPGANEITVSVSAGSPQVALQVTPRKL